jgi:hypothetical protein
MQFCREGNIYERTPPHLTDCLPVVSRPARVEPDAAGVIFVDQPLLLNGLSLYWFKQMGLSGSVSF